MGWQHRGRPELRRERGGCEAERYYRNQSGHLQRLRGDQTQVERSMRHLPRVIAAIVWLTLMAVIFAAMLHFAYKH
jgi:hypothetical protein